jgi:redox-sensing transcriptional repressor
VEEKAVPLSRRISDSAVRRLSLYLRFLEEFEEEGTLTVSSQELARRGGTTAAQIRKDLSLFGSFGKRGLGYAVPPLAARLRDILGLDRSWRIALIGAGRIGSALSEYSGFRERGFRISAIFDSDPARIGTCLGGVLIQDVRDLASASREHGFDIAVLAVPGAVVQEVADHAVSAGIRGILSFAPTQLRVPAGVALNEVNMALELESLSFALHSAVQEKAAAGSSTKQTAADESATEDGRPTGTGSPEAPEPALPGSVVREES